MALGCGILFAVGLIIGGMTQPGRVIGFLDFTGTWDATLLFVMGGAMSTYLFFDRVVTRRRAVPVWAPSFSLPSVKTLDTRLFVGAGMFGVGWGIAGFCPGPALASLGTHTTDILIFVLAMAGGALLYELAFARKSPGEDSKNSPATQS